MEREAGGLQRVVDPDRLAGDLLPAAVDGEVGREVGEAPVLVAGRREAQVLDADEVGRADRRDRDRLPLGQEEARLEPEAARHGRRHDEPDEPGMGDEGEQLRVLVAVPVEMPHAGRVLRLANVEAGPPQRGADVVGRQPAGDDGATREVGVEERVGLDDADLARRPPEARSAIERAHDDRDGEERQHRGEPGSREDPDEPQRLEGVDEPGPEPRLQALAEDRHLLRVVGRRAEGDPGQLRDDDADDAGDGDRRDLDDGEADRREEAVDRAAEAGRRVERVARGSGAGRRDRRGGNRHRVVRAAAGVSLRCARVVKPSMAGDRTPGTARRPRGRRGGPGRPGRPRRGERGRGTGPLPAAVRTGRRAPPVRGPSRPSRTRRRTNRGRLV